MQKRLIVIPVLLIVSIFNVGIACAGVNEAASLFLLKDYSAAIRECKNLITSSDQDTEIAYAYLIFGLSNMKVADLEQARRSFRILVQKFPNSKLVPRAHFALADTYFMERNFDTALKIYYAVLSYPDNDLLSLVYFRLGQTSLKLGRWQEARSYLRQTKQKFPNSLVSGLADRLLGYEHFFTVQVGSFQDYKKARSLADELSEKNLDVYIMEAKLDKIRYYRVRVGKLFARHEAIALKDKLSLQGYPTIIYP